MTQTTEMTRLKLPEMNESERAILELMKEINPQALYAMGFEELGDRIFTSSSENIEYARRKVRDLKERVKSDVVARKLLESIENVLEWEEPGPDISLVSETLSIHMIKEGLKPDRIRGLLDQLSFSVSASLERFRGRSFSAGVRILLQYQILGANEILSSIEKETTDQELLEKIPSLRGLVNEFGRQFAVEGFTDGSFQEVVELLKKYGPELGREKFYPKALKYGFDYFETPAQLERRALRWIREELPLLQSATKSLSKIMDCKSSPEAVKMKLQSRPGVTSHEALSTTIRIRPIIRAFVEESIVGINPKYDATVVETPSYLSAIFPTGAAQGLDALTEHPIQRFYLTTDTKRDPPGGFAEIVNLLVHEEYGHCVHHNNTAAGFAAKAGILEMLPSLHGGSTSEGLAFQRELEFLDALKRLDRKDPKKYSEAEEKYVALAQEFGGFKRTLLEMKFETYVQRIIRFLRVVGDSRINSGKQNLLDFLKWAEKLTGLSQRTVFFQIFPAHESAYPGYATCYAVVGQEIREIQRPFKNDPEKLVKFNAYACSVGYPPRSQYAKMLRNFAKKIEKRKAPRMAARHSQRTSRNKRSIAQTKRKESA